MATLQIMALLSMTMMGFETFLYSFLKKKLDTIESDELAQYKWMMNAITQQHILMLLLIYVVVLTIGMQIQFVMTVLIMVQGLSLLFDGSIWYKIYQDQKNLDV